MEKWSLLLKIAFLSQISFTVSGQIISPDEAGRLAGKAFQNYGLTKGDVSFDKSIITTQSNEPALYIFAEKKGGFVILSAEKRVYPVLGWSDTLSFSGNESEWPPSLRDLIKSWVDQVEYIRSERIDPSAFITLMWQKLEAGDFILTGSSKDVSPLLVTRWSQTCGYNAQCPPDTRGPCGHAVTGCVATAMAQVIRHYAHPVTGVGSSCYTHGSYGDLCADYASGTYNYSNMPNTSGNADVAKLMFHCGVAVSMSYGPYSSGAYSSSVAYAMREHFDYTNGLIISKGSYQEEIWTRILKREMDSNRPVYYSGYGTSGHAFVLDGYKATNHFHVNWGWGGSYDGYFYLNALNPGSMSFTSGQQAIAGMIPKNNFTGLDFSKAKDITCKMPHTDSLSAGTDYVNYYGNIYPATFGKELVYRFSTTLPGRIRIKISGQTESVYTFLLNYPDKDSVVNYGYNGLTVENTLPGTYYIAVEGMNGSEPSFTIEVVCPTADADLDISQASVNPRYIQSLQNNVKLTSTVRNIGNSQAASSSLEYYFSTDAIFDYGSDVLLDSTVIPVLGASESSVINTVITMPDSLLPGYYYLIFVADRQNYIPEADDDNYYPVYVTVPDSGKLDCNSSIILENGKWFRGNTQVLGTNRLEQYSMGWELTGPEVIHSFTAVYNGVAIISFVDKSPGMLFAMVLPVCNENTTETSFRIFNMTDTIVKGEFYAVAGITYFIVVDGQQGASGEYALHITLPEECPVIKVDYWGKTDLCNGDPWPGFNTYWGYSNYQWFRDNVKIPGATYSSFTPSSEGSYHVEITENGCPGVSPSIIVRMDFPPDTAMISTTDGTEFCPGGSASLKLVNTVSYPVNWAIGDKLITGATGTTFTASEEGVYSLYTVNGACRIKSKNTIEVNVLATATEAGERLPLPSDSVEFYYPFTKDNYDVSGHKYMMIGWDYEPVNDRFGNFWQARYLMGNDEIIYSSNYGVIPDDFSLGLWFRTVTRSGGLIAGYIDNQWNPTTTEAVLYMSDNGKLHFWISNGTAPVEISSTNAYNDSLWHFVAIRHDSLMVMEIDRNSERIESATRAVKQKFTGSWTFGGPSVPATVKSMPSSAYFKGAVDDIILLNEASDYLSSYMVEQPLMSAGVAGPVPVCVPCNISFELPYSERGIEYRIWDKTGSGFVSGAVTGTGGYLKFDDIEPQLGVNEYLLFAKSLSTGCETILDTTLVVEINSVCTLYPEIIEVKGLKVFPVPAREKVTFNSSVSILVAELYDVNGRLVNRSSPVKCNFDVDLSGLPGSVYYYRLVTEDRQVLRGRIIVY